MHGLTVGVTPSPRLGLALDLSRESQRNEEARTLATNRRVGAQADWRPFGRAALAGALSLVLTRDDASTQRGRNVELRFEASQGFNVWVRPADGSQARAFIRWARTGAALRLAGQTQPSVRQWTLNGGVSLRFF